MCLLKVSYDRLLQSYHKMFQQANSESIYEGEIRYENDHKRIAYGLPSTSQNDSERQKEDIKMNVDNLKTQIRDVGSFVKKTKRQIAIGLAFALIIILSLLVTLVVLLYVNCNKTTSASGGVENQSQTSAKTTKAKSCSDLKQKQIHTNGIYSIKPEDEFQQIEVFCDMETDGGGWTLVASIHENDIEKKCDAEDRWSEYVSFNYRATPGKTNWESKRIFGDVRQCTESDYKNSAYFALNANDVMIWHVPTKSPTTTMKSRATLRYRTTNHFLQRSGGNLKTLFDERYPLKVKPIKKKSREIERNNMLIGALEKKSAAIRAIFPDWYTYSYGNQFDRITDDKLFYSSGGNRIRFGTPLESFGPITYEKWITFNRPTFVVNTKKLQPFLLVTSIPNNNEVLQNFWLQVHHSRKNADSIEVFKHNVTHEDLFLQYNALQLSNSNDPTLCEFRFVIHSTKIWRSNPPTAFERSYQNNNGTRRTNQFRVTGNPSNIVMGYVLLTRSAGNKVSKEQADEVAKIILQATSTLKELFNEKDVGEGFVVPVTFDRGSTSAVLETIPPNLREFVEPGYLHFRVYNETGYPNAMCPGIKMKTVATEFCCVGGISDNLEESGTCGDFAGWAGSKADIIKQSEASGLAHSHNDISSAILIFYR